MITKNAFTVVFLVLLFTAWFLHITASAQDAGVSPDVVVKVTTVCNRISETQMQCTRYQQGKKPVTFIKQIEKN